MKRFLRIFLCLGTILSLLLSCPPPAGAAEAGNTLLLLQVGNGSASRNGAVCSVPAPAYADNGALLVPLRAAAEAMGCRVSWEPASRQAVVSHGETVLQIPVGSWSFRAGGTAVSLPAPPVLRDGVLYAPLQVFSGLPGFYVHSFGYYEGAYLTISDYPLTQKDADGVPNTAFSAADPDAALLSCRDAAVQTLGPNAGLLDQIAVLLRLQSRRVFTGGSETALCEPGESVFPYRSGDGYLMIPIQFCAEALGGTYALDESGTSTVVYRGRTVLFPPENGYLTADDQRLEHPYYGGCRKDGVSYCSVYAFTSALGCFGYADAESGGILLSPCSLSGRPELLTRAWNRAAGLILQRWETARGFLALTFDDGPSGQYTERLLDGLKARGVHATFFLCNYRISAYPDLMPRYLAEGHELGNHSASHATLTACSSASLASELDLTNSAVERATGVRPVLMRPPGGAYNQTVLSAAGARGMSCILWSLDPQDWKFRSRDAVVGKILANVRDGDIILMHDMYPSSVDAALSVIDTLQAQGYAFVTVSELAALRQVSLAPGSVYSSLR